jgi:hypothetical protein
MQASEQREDGLESDGFDEMVVEAGSLGAARKHTFVISRYCNNKYFIKQRVAPDLLCDLKAVHPRKTDIQEENIGPAGSGRSQGLSAIVDSFDIESDEFQEHRQALCQISIIIRDEDEQPPPEKVHRRPNLN